MYMWETATAPVGVCDQVEYTDGQGSSSNSRALSERSVTSEQPAVDSRYVQTLFKLQPTPTQNLKQDSSNVVTVSMMNLARILLQCVRT